MLSHPQAMSVDVLSEHQAWPGTQQHDTKCLFQRSILHWFPVELNDKNQPLQQQYSVAAFAANIWEWPSLEMKFVTGKTTNALWPHSLGGTPQKEVRPSRFHSSLHTIVRLTIIEQRIVTHQDDARSHKVPSNAQSEDVETVTAEEQSYFGICIPTPVFKRNPSEWGHSDPWKCCVPCWYPTSFWVWIFKWVISMPCLTLMATPYVIHMAYIGITSGDAGLSVILHITFVTNHSNPPMTMWSLNPFLANLAKVITNLLKKSTQEARHFEFFACKSKEQEPRQITVVLVVQALHQRVPKLFTSFLVLGATAGIMPAFLASITVKTQDSFQRKYFKGLHFLCSSSITM